MKQTMYKTTILTAVFALLGVFGFAQMPGMAAGGKGQAGGPPSIGHIYGKVTDSAGKPMSGASVILLQNKLDTVSKKRKDVLVKGVTTKASGEFDFTDLGIMGQYKLKISALGYKAIDQTVAFQMKMPAGGAAPGAGGDPSKQMAAMSDMLNNFEKDLGNIGMKPDYESMQTVVVTGSKPLVKMDIDKKVFNVEKNIVSQGGTAQDVMRNVPSVQVDIDGNVKLRNAAPQIYIDGRPTTLSLDQIPADAIESVEVITNPSAKYDASGGTAGILNIVLKKNRKSGYNGNLMAGVDSRGGWNAGGGFNYRQNKLNFSANVMTNQMRGLNHGTTDRTNLLSDPMVGIHQDNTSHMKGGFMFGRVGMDWFATNRTTFSLGVVRVHGEFHPNDDIQIRTDSLYPSGTISNYSERVTNGTRNFNAMGVQAGMKHNFQKQGEEWTADINYFGGKNDANSLYTTNYFTDNGHDIGATQYQKMVNGGTNRFITIQTDYVRPLSDKTKLETGLRAQLRKLSNTNTTYIQAPGQPDYVEIASAGSNYSNNDNVYAAYASLKSSIKNFGWQFGLRAESSNYKGTMTTTGKNFSNSYPLSLFPSLFLSQKLKKNQELQFSVTRRVNRPNFFQVIPFIDYSDSLNITRGNPDLRPEFTYSAEASYAKTWKGKNNFLASIYYKHTTDLITRYLVQADNPVTGKPDLINTYVNANSATTYGAEATYVQTVTKWWDFTTNLNVYKANINTENLNQVQQDPYWSYFGKFSNNFKLPKNFTVQVSGDYQSKTSLPVSNNQGMMGPPMMQAQAAAQGYIEPFWGIDMAIKKSFLKNNAATISLSVSDIFKTRINRQHSESTYFVQDYARINNPQLFRLNLFWRFGKMDVSLFKKQNSKMNDSSGAMQGMQQ
jgi:ferric enterobactin receptor